MLKNLEDMKLVVFNILSDQFSLYKYLYGAV